MTTFFNTILYPTTLLPPNATKKAPHLDVADKSVNNLPNAECNLTVLPAYYGYKSKDPKSMEPQSSSLQQMKMKLFFVISFFLRTANAVLALSLLMVVDYLTRDIRFAGTVSSVYSVASAISMLVYPMLFAKWRLWKVVTLALIPFSLAACLLYYGLIHNATTTVFMTAIILGSTFPPTNMIIRKVISSCTKPGNDRDSAFTVDSISYDLSYTIAPVLVSVFLNILGSSSPIVMAIITTLIVTPIFIFHPFVRYISRSEAQNTDTQEITLMLDTYNPKVFFPIIIQFFILTMCGVYEAMVNDAFNAKGEVWWISIILGVWSLTSVIGAIIMSKIAIKTSKLITIAICLAIMGAALLPAISLGSLCAPGYYCLFLVMFTISGFPFAYSQGLLGSFLDELCSHRTPIKLWAYLSTASICGYAAGLFIAGQICAVLGVNFTLSIFGFLALSLAFVIYLCKPYFLSTKSI